MKSPTRKFTTWLLPTAALALIGSITYATSGPDGGGKKPTDKGKNSKTVHFEHEKDIDTYLTSVRSFMLVPPRDGRFGASRVPTLHGSTQNKIPGYDEVKSIVAKEYMLQSFVVGHMPKERIEMYRKLIAEGKMLDKNLPKYRMTSVHYEIPVLQGTNAEQDQALRQQFIKTSRDVNEKALAAVDLCFSKGYDDYSDSFMAGGQKSWVSAKSVIASDKSCYSCHTDVKQGEPIGYVVAVLVKKQP